MDDVISHVGSPYLLLINAEERLFFPRRQRLRPHSGAFAGAGVGEAEGNEIVSLSPMRGHRRWRLGGGG